MLVCDAPEFVRWRPDFSSSGQSAPDWTQVRCDGHQLTNGAEWVEWDENPVQVVLCEECGYVHCAMGGYVHASRVRDHVLWTPPRLPVTDDEEHDREEYAASATLQAYGAVAIPAAVWATWPAARVIDALPRTRRSDLLAAWRAAAPPREDAIGTDLGLLEDAFAAVDAVERWFAAEPEAVVDALVPLGEGGVTVFYDRPRFTEWTPAVRVGDAVLPVFGGRITVAATSPDTG